MELKLEPKEILLIRQGLGKLPFDDVAKLIVNIEQQVQAQTQKENSTGENNNGNNVQ